MDFLAQSLKDPRFENSILEHEFCILDFSFFLLKSHENARKCQIKKLPSFIFFVQRFIMNISSSKLNIKLSS